MPDPNPKIAGAWDFGDPAASEKRFRDLLGESSGEFAAEVHTQIARTYSLRSEFDKAHEVLDAIALPENACALLARIHLEKGRTYNSSGEKETAVSHFESALESAMQAGETYHAVDAAHMLAIAAPESDQIAWAQRAIDLADSSDDPVVRYWLGPLNNNLGWSLHESKKFESALTCFIAALDAYRSYGQPNQVHMAEWAIGRCLRSLNRIEEALSIQRRLSIENPDDGYVFEELGECLYALNDDNAVHHFARAQAILSRDSWFAEHEKDRLLRIGRLGKVD